jgi:hypothetical protein
MGHCLGGQWGLCLHGPHGGWLGSEGGGGGYRGHRMQAATVALQSLCGTQRTVLCICMPR